MRGATLLLFISLMFGQTNSLPPEQKAPSTTTPDQKSQGSQSSKGNDYGMGTGARAVRQMGALDILSDTQGVDFGPYLQRVEQEVRDQWYMFIPESIQMKKGKLAIDFAIKKDGNVADMRLVATSGDVALDRPAWQSITASNPLPPLPSKFTGPYLALRLRFYYNPDQADLTQTPFESLKKNCPAASGIAVCINAPSDLEVPVAGSKMITASVGGTKEQAVDWIVECSSSSKRGGYVVRRASVTL